MVKNKFLLLFSIILLNCFCGVYALELDDIVSPKPPAYRVGITDYPETQYVEAPQDPTVYERKQIDITSVPNISDNDKTYADLSIKQLSKEISMELQFDERDMVSDLSLLWQGAATQSDTINFALYKLANPDADKPGKGTVKKLLSSIASMSTLVGAGMSNPLLAGASLIGGNVFNIMSQDTKSLNYKYTKVTDADMIILIRKIEDLQQNAINLYYDYMVARKQLEFATKLVNDRQEKFNLAQKNNASRELVIITDAYYRTALDKQRSARSDFYSKRASLEQFVGNEVLTQFEEELNAREKGEVYVRPEPVTEEEQQEYENTIKSVEEFTKENSQSEEETVQTQEKETVKGAKNKTPKQKAVKEKPVKQKPVKETPAKTKKEKVNQPSNKILPADESLNQKPTSNKSLNGLPPLDEIKVPELKQGGYSIFNEY